MRRMISAATVAVALTASASVATVVVSTPAWAGSSAACKKLEGYASGSHKFQLKKCMPPNAEKTLTGVGAELTTVGGPTTYTWRWNDRATTVVSLSVARTAGVCGSGYSGYTDTGTVTGGSSTYTHVNDVVSMLVCKKSAAPYKNELRLAAASMASL